MRQSQLFTKTRKEAPKDEVSKNAQLLIRGGFIYKEIAGVYAYLPLGLRVLNKITNIIREEMNAIGGQEISLTALQEPEVWQKSGRWDDEVVDVWFKTKLKHGGELGLATTHEEPLTRLMTQYISSYRDLPRYIYQFQTKFRNETRAKSGIMRTREFIMKDLYSFDKSKEDFDVFYAKAMEAYKNIFNRIGIGDKTFLTFASGGSFSKFSHEFQTICDAGEDIIYLSRQKNIAVNKEVYTDEVLDSLNLKKDELEEVKSVEVGNIFPLATKYSDVLGLKYVDETGKEVPVYMGSYGIGPARNMGTVVEVLSDSKGMVWPKEISPFQVHLVGLDLDDDNVKQKAEELYQKLNDQNVEVLYDDRLDTSAGAKLADADLIGITNRVVVSKRTQDKFEYKKRTETESSMVSVDDLFKLL